MPLELTSDMKEVLSVLRQSSHKMTEDAISEDTGLSSGRVCGALHGLLSRSLVRCADSFDPSKRGGHAGVRRWGGCSFIALWEATPEDPEIEPELFSTYMADRKNQQ
jgi:hypothetical protein